MKHPVFYHILLFYKLFGNGIASISVDEFYEKL